MYEIEAITQPKPSRQNSQHNEDYIGIFTQQRDVKLRTGTHKEKTDQFGIIVADGATDVAGRKYMTQTGKYTSGLIAAETAVNTFASTEHNGEPLIAAINDKLAGFYQRYGVNPDSNPHHRAVVYFAAARVNQSGLNLTLIGDVNARLNVGTNDEQTWGADKHVDTLHAQIRAQEIHRLLGLGYSEEEAAKHAGDYIQPLIQAQYQYQNIPSQESPYAFGAVDGTSTPGEYVTQVEIPTADFNTLELFTDGYPMPGGEPTISSWEAQYARVRNVDPFRYLIPAGISVKSDDDRSFTSIRKVES